MTEDDRLKSLETRLAALEAAPVPPTAMDGGSAGREAVSDGGFLHRTNAGAVFRPAALSLHPAWPLALGLVALALGYLGLGLPQHYYQPLFAVLFLLLAYHRGFLRLYPGAWRWPLIGLNFLLLVLVFKLLLGGGLSYPFDWLKVPTLQQVPPVDDSWTQKYLPHFQMVWEAVPGISDWYVNISKFQSMLLIATLIGGLFRFQPFASLTALALLIISFPSYLAFNWDFVLLFLVLGGTAVYLQAAVRQ